jgi:GMP synthase (glutamine-hydrolysing)
MTNATPRSAPRALLVSLRDPGDPMAHQERGCFADRAALPIERLDVAFAQEGRPSLDRLRQYDVVFFGGSGAYSVLDDVPWIRDSFGTLQDVVELRIRSWASCFGFQGLSMALGGEVIRDDERQELGSYRLSLTEAGRSDPLLGALPMEFWAQEGHHDHVVRLPPGVTLLATGSLSENQAFVVDGAPFYASQFHPELTSTTTVERFLHYASLYSQGDDVSRVADEMRRAPDTPEMAQVLSRLVWER